MNQRLLSLLIGTFAVGAGAVSIAGMLGPVAADLGVSAARAGQTIVAYALAFALAAPAAALLLARVCRRRVLLGGLALFTLGMVGSAWAPDFGSLMVARVVAGIGAAIFTPNATVVAASLVPPAERGRAIATVFAGFTLASVFGVPAGTWLGLHAGWRVGMAMTVVLALVALVMVALFVRGRIDAPAASLAQWRAVAHDRRALALLGVTGIAMAGTYAVFAYIGPFLAAYPVPGALGTAGLLLVFGLSGALGNLLSGRYIDRLGADRMVLLQLLVALAGLALLALHWGGTAALIVGSALWSAGAFAANSAQQARLVAHAPALAGALLPANASVLYVGQALGGLAGGALLAWPGTPMWALAALGVALLAAAVALSVHAMAGQDALPARLSALRR
jgi:predicted MFS family arabinose efflux permease